jgi:hypothetical protein
LWNRIQHAEGKILPMLNEIDGWSKESQLLEKRVAQSLEKLSKQKLSYSKFFTILATVKYPQSQSYTALKQQLRRILLDKQDTSLTARTISLNAQLKTTKERANKAEEKEKEYHGYWEAA